MMAIRLAFCDIGDVDLDNGDANGADAVGQGDGGVGVASGVHHNGVILSISLLQFVDQQAFVIGLEVGELVLGKTFVKLEQILFEGLTAVYFGFTLAQEVEVGTV